jgi:hypothetical protein
MGVLAASAVARHISVSWEIRLFVLILISEYAITIIVGLPLHFFLRRNHLTSSGVYFVTGSGTAWIVLVIIYIVVVIDPLAQPVAGVELFKMAVGLVPVTIILIFPALLLGGITALIYWKMMLG